MSARAHSNIAALRLDLCGLGVLSVDSAFPASTAKRKGARRNRVNAALVAAERLRDPCVVYFPKGNDEGYSCLEFFMEESVQWSRVNSKFPSNGFEQSGRNGKDSGNQSVEELPKLFRLPDG